MRCTAAFLLLFIHVVAAQTESPAAASRAVSLGAALPGFPADASVDEAVRRRGWLLSDPTGVGLSKKIGKAIARYPNATKVDVAPDVWYAYQPAHSSRCADAELVAGVWTCGIRRLRCGCVVYAFSHTNHDFADEMEALTPCEVLRFGRAPDSVWNGTLSASDSEAAIAERVVDRPGGRDPRVKYGFLPAKLANAGRPIMGRSLQGLIKAHGHERVDVLYLDLGGGEYAALRAMQKRGFPPIGIASTTHSPSPRYTTPSTTTPRSPRYTTPHNHPDPSSLCFKAFCRSQRSSPPSVFHPAQPPRPLSLSFKAFCRSQSSPPYLGVMPRTTAPPPLVVRRPVDPSAPPLGITPHTTTPTHPPCLVCKHPADTADLVGMTRP